MENLPRVRKSVVSGLSGNEIFCLHRKGYAPGDIVLGNSVFSLGLIGGIGSGLRTLAGGEVTQVTRVIHEGRGLSLDRMEAEARKKGASGITGASSELVQHQGNIEFLSVGSCVHRETDSGPSGLEFSTSDDAQELYCAIDSGFTPVKFVFGNVAYSIGLGGGLFAFFRSMGRGEVKEYSELFNTTRHLALNRITQEAVRAGASAVLGIETSIIPFQGMQEMVMIGTAYTHPALPNTCSQNPITSDLTNQEMWNLIHMGYMPLKLLLGVSVYSIGIVGGFLSSLQSLARGEISNLTSLIYEARENAIAKIKCEAESIGADDVVGVKTTVYDLGNGIIEFMAIGTAVKKLPNLTTLTPDLLPQAIIQDRDTLYNTAEFALGTPLNKGRRR